MKKIILLLILFVCTNLVFAQTKSKTPAKPTEMQKYLAKREKFDPTRNPADDLKAAIAKATAENKRIILDVGGEWCSWCIRMDVFLMRNPNLEKLQKENYVWLKVNMSEENKNEAFLSKYPEIPGYPHIFVLEKDGTLLHSQGTEELEAKYPPIVVPAKVKDKEKYKKEEQEKRNLASYNLEKYIEFLQKWSVK